MTDGPPRTSIFNGVKHRETVSRRTTFYSQSLIKPIHRCTIESVDNEPVNSCHSSTRSYVPFKELIIDKNLLPSQVAHIETAQKWMTLPGMNGKIHKFPLKTILPKVQMTIKVPDKHLPRDVEVDRRRRIYNKVDIQVELEKVGLYANELFPTEEQYYILTENAFKHFLPISFFDNTDFDTYSPEAWLKLGEVEGEENYPLPAKAFLPYNKGLMQYKWQNAAITTYNSNTHKWTVLILEDECVYEVPKIQIMFLAEDPFIFKERLKHAIQMRNQAEHLIMTESLIDCVLWQNLHENHVYEHKLVDKLMANVKTDAAFYHRLKTEIYLVYERLMTSYEFEKIVKLLPYDFAEYKVDVLIESLPQVHPSARNLNERQFVKSLLIDINERRNRVLNWCLFYTAKGIEAMLRVAAECQYIETLFIFVCSFSKPLGLNEFLNCQQQQSTTVTSYLRKQWPSKVSFGIIKALRALGKGWLDISLKNFKVYQVCKISRFILQVKLRMQESIQVLLETSIKAFTNLLGDPCKKILTIDENYQWTNDFIVTEFPYGKPIFSMVLTITDAEEVVYSNQPEEFAPALKELFKKSLEKTSGIRQIDAECLSRLRFAKNLFILTVELIEELYLKCDAHLQRCYEKAIYPLKSYAHKYDRFIQFYLLNIPAYMTEYKQSQKSSMQVKADILEHKRCKEEMRAILPATIVIGPFLVIVDPMKQYMIKKRIEIVRKIFEYYIDRMYDTNERLLERCLEMYNKINERPQSIEHLYSIRDFAVEVPDLVEQLKADTQIMWIEYDMLDSFFYNLPDHQFAMKWEVYAWPKNILDRLSTLREEQKIDIEDFKRQHLSECTVFEEHLESLNEELQQFSLQFNPQKVMEVAVEVGFT